MAVAVNESQSCCFCCWSNGRGGMAGEAQNEMVQYIYKSSDGGESENGRNITKVENMGFTVGQRLIERLRKGKAPFRDEVAVIEFICNEFWTFIFKKQVDNLQIDDQSNYVLRDNKFPLLVQLCVRKRCLTHMAFTCGLLKGALSYLGLESIVTAEVSVLPACTFYIAIQKIY